MAFITGQLHTTLLAFTSQLSFQWLALKTTFFLILLPLFHLVPFLEEPYGEALTLRRTSLAKAQRVGCSATAPALSLLHLREN